MEPAVVLVPLVPSVPLVWSVVLVPRVPRVPKAVRAPLAFRALSVRLDSVVRSVKLAHEGPVASQDRKVPRVFWGRAASLGPRVSRVLQALKVKLVKLAALVFKAQSAYLVRKVPEVKLVSRVLAASTVPRASSVKLVLLVLSAVLERLVWLALLGLQASTVPLELVARPVYRVTGVPLARRVLWVTVAALVSKVSLEPLA